MKKKKKDDQEKEPDICSLIKSETIIAGAFRAAQLLRTSDYVFMRGMRFDDIPKRRSFHLLPLKLPECVIVHDDEDEEFSYDWAVELAETETVPQNRVMVLMPDGSCKNDCGGAGFFACRLSVMKGVDFEELIEHKLSKEVQGLFDLN